MSTAQKSLLNVCLRQKMISWSEMKQYAEQFTKYDNLTYRELDRVWEAYSK